MPRKPKSVQYLANSNNSGSDRASARRPGEVCTGIAQRAHPVVSTRFF
ncbi:hypothetical protein PSAC2689_20455 [Paraburkholderia sacchari]